MLETLLTRTDGFRCLIKSLYVTNQTGSLIKLLRTAEKHHPRKFTLDEYGIDVPRNAFLDKTVLFEGKQLPLHEICRDMNPEELSKLLKDNMSLDLFENVISNTVLTLSESTLPNQVSYYIPRMVTVNKEVDVSVFEELRSSVFAIENIDSFQLFTIGKAFRKAHNRDNLLCDESSSQIEAGHLTVRFILLKTPDHIENLVNINFKKAPLYWLKYENGKFFYVKGLGSQATENIKKFLRINNEIKYSEDEFIFSCLHPRNRNPVIVYDSVGTGKTSLLISLAHKIKDKYIGTSVLFVHIPDMVGYFSSKTLKITFETVKQFLLEITKATKNQFALQLQNALFVSPLNLIHLFMDGYDEVDSVSRNLANNLLQTILNNFKKFRVTIATRPHFSNELESLFGVTGHEICPFDEEDQIVFLTKYWQKEHSIQISDSVISLSKMCLKKFKSNIPPDEKDIAGIPLQCKLVAELCSNFAKREPIIISEQEFTVTSMYQMYRQFVEKQFSAFNSDFLYQFHIDKAMHLLFPGNITLNECPESMDSVCRIGILEKRDLAPSSFVHRTFADFLVSENIRTCLHTGFMHSFRENITFIDFFFNDVLKIIDSGTFYSSSEKNFLHLGVLNFLNSGVTDENFSQLITANHISQLNTSKFYNGNKFQLLLSCCLRNNLSNLFFYIVYLFLDLNLILISKDAKAVFDIFENDQFGRYINFVGLKLNLNELDGWDTLLVCASQYANLKLITFTHKLVKIITGKNIGDFNYNYSKHTPISVAARRGNCNIVNYLLMLNNYKFDPNSVIYCIQGSCKDSNSVVDEKIHILKVFLNLNSTILEYDSNNTYPLLVEELHPKLIICLIELRADIRITTMYQENVFHLAATYCTPDEFYDITKFAVQNSYIDFLFSRDTNGYSPIQNAIKFMEVKTGTLDLLSNYYSANSVSKQNDYIELELAIEFGRSARVLSDIMAAMTKYRTKDFLNFPISACKNISLNNFLVNQKIGLSQTLLSIALQVNGMHLREVIGFLIEEGAGVNSAFILNERSSSLKIVRDFFRFRFVNPLTYAVENELNTAVVSDLRHVGAKKQKTKCLFLLILVLLLGPLTPCSIMTAHTLDFYCSYRFRRYCFVIFAALYYAALSYFVALNTFFRALFGAVLAPILGIVLLFIAWFTVYLFLFSILNRCNYVPLLLQLSFIFVLGFTFPFVLYFASK